MGRQHRAELRMEAKSKALMYSSHLESLKTAVSKMTASQGPSNGELENIMQQFINQQSGSQDHCPSLLLEAKHQLNELHVHIHELAIEINTTEASARSEEYMLETEYAEFNETEEAYM